MFSSPSFLGPYQLINETRYLSGNPDTRDYDAGPLISALNLVLQQHASRTGVRVGKNRYFFRSSSESIELGAGVEAWKGFFVSCSRTPHPS